MTDEAPGAAVFGFASSLLNSVLQIVGAEGDVGGFWQVFDAKPDEQDAEPEIHRDRLDQTVAREYMRRRKSAGFKGLCGFCCFDKTRKQLYIEAFDTRNDMGIALGGPLRRTFFGRYRPAGDNAEILGCPSLQ